MTLKFNILVLSLFVSVLLLSIEATASQEGKRYIPKTSKDRIWCVSYKRVKAGDNRSISKYVGFERVNESRSKLLKQGIRDKEDIMDKTARRVFEGLNYMLGGSKGMKWNEQLLVDVDSGRNIVCGCWAWNPKQVNWNRGSAFSCFYDVKDADRRRDYLSPYR